jgi:DNA polymerase-3 subunit alpha
MTDQPVVIDRDKQIEAAEKAYPGPKDFVHLHSHSVFSPLDGIPEPKEYVNECLLRGFPAMVLTDHGSMGGIPDGYLAAKGTKVKFIAGCEIYFNDRHLEWMEKQRQGISIGVIKAENAELRDEYVRNRHVTVLTKNMIGYKNLIMMLTNAWEIGHYYKPRIWLDVMKQHKEGLIILSGCLNGPVCHYLRKGDTKKALDYIKKFKDVWGDDYYLEVQMPGKDLLDGVKTFIKLMTIAKSVRFKAVLTNDTHYLTREGFKVQKLLMAIDQKMKVDDPNLFHVNSDEQFYKTRAELRQTFLEQGYAYGDFVTIKDFEAACDNTLEVAQKCEGFKPDTSLKLPEVPNADKELTRLVLMGLRRINKQEDEVYVARAKRELKMIIEKGFSSYFLITRDLIAHSRNLGFEVGPARGSVGGSLVAYLIQITTIDPIRFKLNFERFISPSRGGNLLRVTMS